MAVSLLVPAVDNGRNDAESDRYDRHLRMAVLLQNAVRHGSGGTVDPRGECLPVPDRGYLVSLHRFGWRFERLPTLQDIAGWLEAFDIDNRAGAERLFAGIWRHPATSAVHCDVNILIEGRTQAMRRGALEDQHSIFDLRCNCARPVDRVAATEKFAVAERSTS